MHKMGIVCIRCCVSSVQSHVRCKGGHGPLLGARTHARLHLQPGVGTEECDDRPSAAKVRKELKVPHKCHLSSPAGRLLCFLRQMGRTDILRKYTHQYHQQIKQVKLEGLCKTEDKSIHFFFIGNHPALILHSGDRGVEAVSSCVGSLHLSYSQCKHFVG